jgi:hypothetical protein
MAKRRGHGEGSIYQLPDGRWRAAVSLGWRETKGGQLIWRRKIVIGKTRYEVQEELKKLLRDQQRGINIDPEKQTVQEFLEHWLEQVAKPRVRAATYASYDWIVKKHLVPGLGRIRLAKLFSTNCSNPDACRGLGKRRNRKANRTSPSLSRASRRAPCSTYTRRCAPRSIRPSSGI